MTNQMLQTNDTDASATLATRLLVAMEMSLKSWRLVMSPEGGARNRVKTVEAGLITYQFQIDYPHGYDS